jgi:hypothetical protein
MAEKKLNISGKGLKVKLFASVSFPLGIDVEVFADDANAIETSNFTTKQAGMTTNGTILIWENMQPINCVINVAASGSSYKSLSTLFELNRAEEGKLSANDSISIIATLPDGEEHSFMNGSTGEGSGITIGADTKKQTRAFNFFFGSYSSKIPV